MLSEILVATGASEISRGLIECLDGLRRVGSQRAVLAHVVNVRETGVLYLYLRRLTEPVLERQKSSLEKAGFQIETETAARAFLYLEHAVAETKSAVTLLHVQDRARIDPHLIPRLEEFHEIDRDRLERLRRTLLEKGAPSVEIEIPIGSPTGMILERARRGMCSLIVMGSQARGYLSEIFLGSVAHNIARRAPLPVLFVPALR